MSRILALLTGVALAVSCSTTAPAAGGFCETDDLRSRANIPTNAVCENDVYDIPTAHPDHIYQITHSRRSLPFSEFENWLRQLGRDPAKRQSDQEFIDHVMNWEIRYELSGFSTVEGPLDFEWLDGAEQWLEDWNRPVPADYLPTGYPAESCVHAKLRMRHLVREGTAVRNEHVLDCWIVDFPTRTVRDDRITFYESYVPERGAEPRAEFDQDARALFRSFRPPL